MRNYKRFKYITYLVGTSFIIAFGLLGVIFIAVENTGGFANFDDTFGKTLLLDNLHSPLTMAGTILLYDGFIAMFLSFMVAVWIATDVYATTGDRWFLITSIVPLIGNIHALFRVFRETNLTLSQAVEAEAIEENVRTAIIEETNEIRAHKIDQEKALKIASKHKVYITISKRKDKKTKKIEKVWSCIDHMNKNKSIFKTKKEALIMGGSIDNPKTLVIHDAKGKFEYWLTYIDDSNIPMIKAPRTKLAEFESGENAVLKILGVKAVAKRVPEIVPVVRKQIRRKIVEEVSVVADMKDVETKTNKTIAKELKTENVKRPEVLSAHPETKVVSRVVKVVKTVVSGDDPDLETAKDPITVKLTKKKQELLVKKQAKQKVAAKNKKIIEKRKAAKKKPVAKKAPAKKKPAAKKKPVAKKKPAAKKK